MNHIPTGCADIGSVWLAMAPMANEPRDAVVKLLTQRVSARVVLTQRVRVKVVLTQRVRVRGVSARVIMVLKVRLGVSCE